MEHRNSTFGQQHNFTDEQIDDYLLHLNMENAKLMIPTLIYISLLIITGVFGNILVIIVYGFRFKPSTTRTFIIGLAVFDLLNNTMAQPGEMVDIVYAYRFTNNHLCKLKRFFNYFTTFSSVFCLAVVAIDRYRKICRPLRIQIRIKTAKICIGVVVLCSLAITLPSLMLNGVKNIPTKKAGILGTECKYADNFQNALFPKVFLGVQFLIFLFCLTMMIVLYSLLGRTVFKHSQFNFREKRRSVLKSVAVSYSSHSSSGPGSSGTGVASLDSDIHQQQNASVVNLVSETPQEIISSGLHDTHSRELTLIKTGVSQVKDHDDKKLTHSTVDETDGRQNQEIDVKDEKNQVTTDLTSQLRKHKILNSLSDQKNLPGFDKLLVKAQQEETKDNAKKMKSRTTLMLFVITLVFLVSYLPYLSISIVKMFNKNFVKSLSTSAFMVYNVVLRSHYINSAVNPLVYSFCNSKFRQEVRNVLCVSPCKIKK